MENELRSPGGWRREGGERSGRRGHRRRHRPGGHRVMPLTFQTIRAHSSALRVPLHAAGGRRAGDAARRRDRRDADDRSRAGAARAGRARRLEAHRTADAHRQARRAAPQRQVRARGFRHRRAVADRSSVPEGEAHRRLAHLGRDVPPRSAARLGRDVGLAHGARAMAGRPSQLSEVQLPAAAAGGVRHDDAVRADAQRAR